MSIEKFAAEVQEATKRLAKPKKVHLGIVSELEKAIDKIDQQRAGAYAINKDALTLKETTGGYSVTRLVSEWKELDAAANNKYKYVDQAAADAKAAFTSLTKSASDLGIAVNNIPVYKSYEQAKKQLTEIEGFVRDAKTVLAKIK